MHIEIKSDKTKYIVILNHNITNRNKEHTTEPCLHAPAVSMTLILSIDYCLSTYTNVVTTFTIQAGIIAALTFIYLIYCFYVLLLYWLRSVNLYLRF